MVWVGSGCVHWVQAIVSTGVVTVVDHAAVCDVIRVSFNLPMCQCIIFLYMYTVFL